MEGSAIKSTNYAARLAMPLIHTEDRQESPGEWSPAPFSCTFLCGSPFLYYAVSFVVFRILIVRVRVKREGYRLTVSENGLRLDRARQRGGRRRAMALSCTAGQRRLAAL